MLEMFEKLINEHGSSVILKERIELISDRYALLEESNTHLKDKVSDLENKLAVSVSEIENLQAQLSVFQNKKTDNNLGKNELIILNQLFENHHEVQIGQIANMINADISTTKYHIKNLLDNDFLYRILLVNAPETYKINDNGIKFVVESKNA